MKREAQWKLQLRIVARLVWLTTTTKDRADANALPLSPRIHRIFGALPLLGTPVLNVLSIVLKMLVQFVSSYGCFYFGQIYSKVSFMLILLPFHPSQTVVSAPYPFRQQQPYFLVYNDE